MKLSEILHQPEGRRFDFKRELPTHADLCKTAIAFANDAGGEIYIGIQNNPREIVGVPESDLFKLEEKISQIVVDGCTPFIRHEIMFIQENEKHLLKIIIHRGGNTPYYLKSVGEENGTYVRSGSTNRQASNEMIQELKRQALDISIDSQIFIQYDEIKLTDLNEFSSFYQSITHEKFDMVRMQKNKLIKQFNGSFKPTGAYFLFADEDIKSNFFPYAKVECARFKGTTFEETLDRKTFQGSIIQQAEMAYDFILRHINKGSTIEGVYTKSRWEYPIIAVREVIRNAIVHRDYSLTGKDIKVAIFDDMIEITSPGKLMFSIDYNDRESGQSDVRNKVIAPIFKRLGIIDQWGNGLKLIDEELKRYSNEIEFLWQDTGMQFQVQFVKKQKKDRIKEPDTPLEAIDPSHDELIQNLGTKLGLSWDYVGTKLGPSWHQVIKILNTVIHLGRLRIL